MQPTNCCIICKHGLYVLHQVISLDAGILVATPQFHPSVPHHMYSTLQNEIHPFESQIYISPFKYQHNSKAKPILETTI